MPEPSLPSILVVRFGVFEADIRNRELRKRGRKIPLQDKPFAVLIALMERPGELVERQVLRSKLWPSDTFIDFDHGLNNAVKRLREALGDSAEHPLFIETVPRRGYRFVASVSYEGLPDPGCGFEIQAAGGASDNNTSNVSSAAAIIRDVPVTVEPHPPDNPISRLNRRRKLLLLATALVVAGVGLVWLSITRFAGQPHINSVAVLPLTNLARDDSEDYFADGMTEELITQLAKMGSFRVISRTSVMRFKKTRKSLSEIARQLKVDALVVGAFRKAGDRVRITVQLLRPSPDHHLWAEAYDSDIHDVLTLQRDVAREIASRIQEKLAPQTAAIPSSTKRIDPETYEAYLRGRYFLARRSAEAMKKAVGYFQQALHRDPQYAQAYAGVAVAYVLLGMYELLPPGDSFPKAKEFANRALHLNNTLAEADTARATVASYWEFDWLGAEREFERAIALDPGSAIAHHWYGEHLIRVGRFEQAASELKRARELDPLSLPINSTLGRIYGEAHHFNKAIEQCKKTLELDPNFAMAHWCLGTVYLAETQYAMAIPELEIADKLGTTPLIRCDLGFAYAAVGNHNKASAVLEALKLESQSGYISPYLMAAMYGALGEKADAFNWLERAFDERDCHVAYLPMDPIMAPLRSDPRFPLLIRRLKVPG